MSENPSPSQSGAALSTPQTSPSAPLRAADAGPVSELSHSSIPAPPPPRFNLSLPSASQPDISSRFQHQYQTEINVFSDLCYYSLTTLLGMQTLGEEYCDIMQISNTTKTFPTLARRSALVFWHVLMPYLYSKGSQELRRRTRPQPQHQQRRFGQTHLDATLHDQGAKPATPAWRQKLKKTIHDWLPSVQTFLKTHGHSAHLAIFYFFGAYYSLSKRVTGIRYIFNRKLSPGEERSGYEVLGVLIVIQLAIQLVQWRRQTVAAAQEKAAAAALASGAGVGKESLLDKNAVEEEEEEDDASTFGLETSDLATTSVRLRGVHEVQPLIELFLSYGHSHIDSARTYTDSEAVLAQVLKRLPAKDASKLEIATKVFPQPPGNHTKENVIKSLTTSLAILEVDSVEVFYLHARDHSVPLEETLEAVDQLYKAGKFKHLGISNYSVKDIETIWDICRKKGYVTPLYYQGMGHSQNRQVDLTRSSNFQYSPIARDDYLIHKEILDKYNMRYFTYNSLAAGVLTGKHSFSGGAREGTRFHQNSGHNDLWNRVFWNEDILKAVDVLGKATANEGIPLAEATLRWMRHHSDLTENDGILVGSSSLAQLHQNLEALDKGPLPESLVQAFEDAWLSVAHLKIIIFQDAIDSTKA
ncbi:hypothetical protein DFQ27_009545 [Actinomortierella ambigua]|uniref:RING-type E3 ubiquitin transferase n=1 Tax=Actinomortierella ambigua TaxID=1343610 RepID=A0A9P6UAM2_9FUNG|nr:hypothetical protein DFQ27_009545 [Actinomortierella ambigua]